MKEDMSKPAHELGSSSGPPEFQRRLEVVPDDAPERAFFISEGTREADFVRLRKVAETSEGGDKVLLAVLEEIGLTDSAEEVTASWQQAEELFKKPLPNDTDLKLFTHLQHKLGPRIALERTIGNAYHYYQSAYWGDYRRGIDLDAEKLVELYEVTRTYDNSWLLYNLTQLREKYRNISKEGVKNIIEAERTARILIADEQD